MNHDSISRLKIALDIGNLAEFGQVKFGEYWKTCLSCEHHVLVREFVIVLSATVLVLDQGVMAKPTFDHERFDLYPPAN